jgi:DNA-binding transcriptional MerR regulator/GGDEF domain-containing protein
LINETSCYHQFVIFFILMAKLASKKGSLFQEVGMEDRNHADKRVEDFLQEREMQIRIRDTIQRVRSEITVTIGRAASLFGFTENQLRDWEERGLLKPNYVNKQRQYSYADLDKLAIIRVLTEAHFTPSEIPSNIEELWQKLTQPFPQQNLSLLSESVRDSNSFEQRLEEKLKLNFWRYFIPRTLRLVLSLITENNNTVAGIVLPCQPLDIPLAELSTDQLSKVGLSLIGWSGQNGYFSTLLDPKPQFAYPTDFKLQLIQDENNRQLHDEHTLIIVERQILALDLNPEVKMVIHRLLAPIYNCFDEWHDAFGISAYDVLLPTPNFQRDIYAPDDFFDKFTDTIVELGGRDAEGRLRWHSCCILLAKDSLLPLDQRTLVIRAVSKYASEKLGELRYSTDTGRMSIKAFQGSHILLQQSYEDHSNDQDKYYTRLAMPIGGEGGQPQGVLYVSGNVSNAFEKEDMSVLRIVARILEDLLKGDVIGKQTVLNLSECITEHDVIDRSFVEFGSETQFVEDFRELMLYVDALKTEDLADEASKDGKEPTPGDEKWVSCIAVDIDKLGSLANRYGDLMVRNLCREVGLCIQGQFNATIGRKDTCKIYHIHRDRFYILMKGVGEEQALEDAQRLRNQLSRPYRVNSTRIYVEEPTLPDGMIVISEITAHLVVTSYRYEKLKDILNRYLNEKSLKYQDHKTGSNDNQSSAIDERYKKLGAIDEVCKKIISSFNDILKVAMDAGGNKIFAWNHKLKKFLSYPLPVEEQKLVEEE